MAMIVIKQYVGPVIRALDRVPGSLLHMLISLVWSEVKLDRGIYVLRNFCCHYNEYYQSIYYLPCLFLIKNTSHLSCHTRNRSGMPRGRRHSQRAHWGFLHPWGALPWYSTMGWAASPVSTNQPSMYVRKGSWSRTWESSTWGTRIRVRVRWCGGYGFIQVSPWRT